MIYNHSIGNTQCYDMMVIYTGVTVIYNHSIGNTQCYDMMVIYTGVTVM